LKLGKGACSSKTGKMGPIKKLDDILRRFDTIYECDRHTDRHWPTASTAERRVVKIGRIIRDILQ